MPPVSMNVGDGTQADLDTLIELHISSDEDIAEMNKRGLTMKKTFIKRAAAKPNPSNGPGIPVNWKPFSGLTKEPGS